jgi:Tol biopolymer transport system component
MTADRWTQIESLFLAAREQPAERRGAFLARTCGHDALLRGEVEALLRYAELSGGILSAPGAEWAMQLAAACLQPGQRIGPYEIQGLAGAGGMGEVYLARDERLDRQVALKLLLPESGRAAGWSSRFEREAKTLSALNHPNILTVYDVGEAGSRRWMATEFVAGTTLRDRMASGPPSTTEALAIWRQVLAALAAAHAAGIVHRDVKPENVMVRPDGIVKLLDFGLAKPIAGGGDLTGAGPQLGTVRYMAPEQLAGRDPGPRADVWAAGVVLAELLAGAHPFPGATPAHAMVAIQEAPPRLPADLPLRHVIERALAKSPEGRYADAGEMLAALDEPAPGRWPTPWRWPALRWWGAAAVVALMALTAVEVSRRLRRPEPFQKTDVRRLATVSRANHVALSPDGEFLAYTVEDSGHHTLWLQQMNGSPARAVPAVAPHGFAGVAFSRDRYLYYVAYDAERYGQLHRLALVGGEARWILRDVDSPPAFAPDGARLAFVRNDTRRNATVLVTAGVDGGQEHVLAVRRSPFGFSTAGCAWSPDGRHVFVAAAVRAAGGATRASLIEADAATGRTREHAGDRWAWIGSVASAGPRGIVFPAVLIGSQSTQVVLRSWSGQESAINTASAQGSFWRLAATADGRQIVTIHTDRAASILLAGRERLDAPRRVVSASGAFYDVTFGPSPYLLAQTFSGVRPGLVRVARDGSFAPLLAAALVGRSPVTAPDGKVVVFVAPWHGTDQIWRVGAEGAGARPLTGGPGSHRTPTCCTADGRVVFARDATGYSTLWSVPLRGGEAVQLSRRPALQPTLDDTGSGLAFVDRAAPDAAVHRVVVTPVDALDRRTPVPAVPPESFFRWSPGGGALTFVRTEAGVSNLWEAAVGGGAPRPLTRFTEQTIFGFDWSRDGKEVVLLRGSATSNLLLITEREE